VSTKVPSKSQNFPLMLLCYFLYLEKFLNEMLTCLIKHRVSFYNPIAIIYTSDHFLGSGKGYI